MRTIKILAIIGVLLLTSLGNEVNAQVKPETAVFSSILFYDGDKQHIYFVSDVFNLCNNVSEEHDESYEEKLFWERLESDFKEYIEGEYYNMIKGMDSWSDNGRVYVFEDESSSENYSDAKRKRNSVVADFTKKETSYRKVKIIKVSRLDFDFNLPCN